MNSIANDNFNQQRLIELNMPMVCWKELNNAFLDILEDDLPCILHDVKPYLVLIDEIEDKLWFLSESKKRQLKALVRKLISAINKVGGEHSES